MVILEFIKWLWQAVIASTFLTAFLATMLGVFSAFWLNSIWHRYLVKRKICSLLCMVFLESKQNARVCMDAQDLYLSKDPSTPMRRPSIRFGSNALSDPELLNFIPFDEVNLLRLYVDRLDVLSRVLETVHQMRVSSVGPSFSLPGGILNIYKHNVASAAAHTRIVQERFLFYHNKYASKLGAKMEEIEKSVTNYKEIALKRKIDQKPI